MQHSKYIFPIFFIVSIIFAGLPLVVRAQTKNLPVPFTSQAPFNNWRQPWYDACEETSVVMVDSFYKEKYSLTKLEARDKILELFKIKNTFLGESLDESVETLANLINLFLPWEARPIENPTVDDIIAELENNQPVIIPAYAPILKNPHFRGVFPYHMFVISGYDSKTKEFIVQEPGTSYGLNFRYSYDTVISAIHNFILDETDIGPKRLIATQKTLTDSATSDGDNDGLSKQDEILYGTSLTMQDTDLDGFTDGNEVENGFSPIINEQALLNGSVIKTKNEATVYKLTNGVIYPFMTEKSFLGRGYQWGQIVVISDKFKGLQKTGNALY